MITAIAIGTSANNQVDVATKPVIYLNTMTASDIGQYIPDAVVINEQLHPTANLSYKVAGKRYYPIKTVDENFSQTGKASWYGPGFHGRKTSSGERFDMNMMTAAHPTLPIPSYAKVTNLANGKSVVVRINDRGPFHGNRVIDLSKAAASKLGFLKRGITDVHIEPLGHDKPNENVVATTKARANVISDTYSKLNSYPAISFFQVAEAKSKSMTLSQATSLAKEDYLTNDLLKLLE